MKLSYGYHRAEILGALTSIVMIWVLIFWLLIEAVDRCINPEEIDGPIMLLTAIVGLICNIINIFTLHSHGFESHNHTHTEEHEHNHSNTHLHD